MNEQRQRRQYNASQKDEHNTHRHTRNELDHRINKRKVEEEERETEQPETSERERARASKNHTKHQTDLQLKVKSGI